MSLPPIFYHYFTTPLPYARTLHLQESIHALQLLQRRTGSHHADVLLLLQHRPVYTGGRRQTALELAHERARLEKLGADFVATQRGGQTTYHGPGQITGYPLLDLGRAQPATSVRDYICRLERTLRLHLREAHGLAHHASAHTGVFLDARTKVGSIGVQVRHRLTSHGFALNVTREPRAWFDAVVACGLDGVGAGSVEGATGKSVGVEGEVGGLVARFGRTMGREVRRLEVGKAGELGELIEEMEEAAAQAGPWPSAPARA